MQVFSVGDFSGGVLKYSILILSQNGWLSNDGELRCEKARNSNVVFLKPLMKELWLLAMITG